MSNPSSIHCRYIACSPVYRNLLRKVRSFCDCAELGGHAGATVWVTFAGSSGDTNQLLLNWVAVVRELEVPHLVVRTFFAATTLLLAYL